MGLGRALRVAAVLAICVLVFAAGTTNGAEPRGGSGSAGVCRTWPRPALAQSISATTGFVPR